MTGRRSPVTVAAAAVLAVVAVCAVAGPWLSPQDPDAGVLLDALSPPGADHWLGADYLGRDILSRVIAGARVAAVAGVEATTIALVLGVSVGLVIGLAGGWPDRIVMRLIDGISAIPALVLAIAMIAALGPGLTRSMLAVGLAFAMAMTRLVRGLALAERERLYVDGARVIGADRRRLLWHHIAPNVAGPIAVQATLVFAAAIAIEAGLSFLGLGAQPPAASWGSMLSAAQRTIREAPFQAIPPGVAIVATVLSINVLGDAAVRRHRGSSHDHPTGHLEPVTIHPTPPCDGDTRPSDHNGRSGDGPDGVPPEGAAVDPSSGGAGGPDRLRSRSGRPGAAVGPSSGGVGGVPVGAALLRAEEVGVRYGSTVAVGSATVTVAPGEVVALVGESGSGKTSLAMALAGLLTPPAEVTATVVRLDDGDGPIDLVDADDRGKRRWRSRVGVVFQEPAASLNPLQTVGRQLRDVIRARVAAGGEPPSGSVDDEIVELLTAAGLRRPGEVRGLRPDQISGGMAQRAMIALALAKRPRLLVADEPTTALDVTVQAEIIALLRRLCSERRLGVVLVTHDLGVAGELADRVLVLYRGRVVESGTIRDLVLRPRHPYTSALVSAVPQNEPGRPFLTAPEAVPTPAGSARPTPVDHRPGPVASDEEAPVPAPEAPDAGTGTAAAASDDPWVGACAYRHRCLHATALCHRVSPATVGGDDHPVACHLADELTLAGARPVPTAEAAR